MELIVRRPQYLSCTASVDWSLNRCAVGKYFFDNQAIIDAYNNPNYNSLSKDIRAVVFLGTPHRGADLANILNLILTVTFSSSRFVKQLTPDNEAIKAINANFIHRAKSLRLVSFFETVNTRVKWVISP